MPSRLIEPIAWGVAIAASTPVVYGQAGAPAGDEMMKWSVIAGAIGLGVVALVRTISPVFFEQMQRWEDFKKASLTGQVDNLNIALAEMRRSGEAKEGLIDIQNQQIAEQNRRLVELNKLVAEERQKRHDLANDLNVQHLKSLEEIDHLKASIKANRTVGNTNTTAITDLAHATGVPIVTVPLIDDTSGDMPTLNVPEPAK